MRWLLLISSIFFGVAPLLAQDRGVFRVELEVPTTSVLAAMEVPINVRATNITDQPVQTVANKFTLSLQAFGPDGGEINPCPGADDHIGWAVVRGEDPEGRLPGTSIEATKVFCRVEPGLYRLHGMLEDGMDHLPPSQRSEDLWRGTAISDPFEIEVKKPQGMDREVYDAFSHAPLDDSERYGELLRRFPTSTYAAYVVWYRLARGVDRGNTEGYLTTAQKPLYRFSNSVPCDGTGPCTKNGWMSLKGAPYLEWRDDWFELVLKHHPEAWFADEIRFRLSLDLYVRGDKTGCAALLEHLEQHGRNNIAAKASDLLAAMRAKGMLEEPEAGGEHSPIG